MRDDAAESHPFGCPPPGTSRGRHEARPTGDDRFSRQLRLAEVGDHGQARISAAEFVVRGGDGAILESEYLHRAGAEKVTILPRSEPEPFVHQTHFRFVASRRVAAGAWRALGKLRKTLGVGS
jgi:hypothetical protein